MIITTDSYLAVRYSLTGVLVMCAAAGETVSSESELFSSARLLFTAFDPNTPNTVFDLTSLTEYQLFLFLYDLNLITDDTTEGRVLVLPAYTTAYDIDAQLTALNLKKYAYR